tara:strand:- start:11 stop:226 length:216 start_codon:yes stop_codon:yes gene_type:complete
LSVSTAYPAQAGAFTLLAGAFSFGSRNKRKAQAPRFGKASARLKDYDGTMRLNRTYYKEIVRSAAPSQVNA